MSPGRSPRSDLMRSMSPAVWSPDRGKRMLLGCGPLFVPFGSVLIIRLTSISGISSKEASVLNGKKIVVVLPAYNAAKTLEETYQEIPLGIVDEVVLVDGASRDATAEVASRLGIKTIVHERNLGYGGNQKTCYRAALD